MKNRSSIQTYGAALLLAAVGFAPCAQRLCAQVSDTTTQSLLDKAHALEGSGHLDIAAQTWQQVLLADPKNTEALAGLARSAKLSGNSALANVYLDRLRAINPNDPNLARVAEVLHNQPSTTTHTAQAPKKIARLAQEQEAYRALNAKNLPEAETGFKAILATDPKNAQALAGMGYVRMQQSNFGGAINFLEQAKHNGARDAGLDSALESARFNQAISQGSVAMTGNDLPNAEQQYRTALILRPSSGEALEGLGNTLLKAQQSQAAIDVYERFVKAKPSAAAAWRGLFAAQYGAGNAPEALTTEHRIPLAVRTELARDPDFLRSLASAYSAVGRDADAQRVLSNALELPFPPGAKGLQAETQLQYASLLLQANRLDQAAGLFKQVLAADLTNTAAWQGLIRVEHAMKEDPQALQSLQAMPPTTYDVAMRDPGFQITVVSIYQSQNKLDIAQDILEKSIAQQQAAGQKPSTPVLLELASIYLARQDAQHAFTIYRAILTENPDRPEVWKGLLTVLHTSNRNRDALAQIQQIPLPVRQQLENDPDYLQTVSAVYNALGQPHEARVFIQRAEQHYAAQHTAAPADIDIQDAWLLFNDGNDAGLYRQLMLLGSRQDLNDEQRRTIQTIWINWAVRRANQAAASGDTKRSLAILNAAARSFPDNPGVLRALASGYARAGLPKQAVAIFKSQDMTAATASDYKSAVGAALAEGDVKIAEAWLRYGLDEYPKDAEMLSLAAKFEQARGNSARAADYYRASLAALPPGDPGVELAAELSQPQLVTRLPAPAQPQDLATLLSTPDSSTRDGRAKPYLPTYSNAYSKAPVEINTNVVPSYMANPHTQSSGRSTSASYAPETASTQAQLQIPQHPVSSQPLTTQPQEVYGPYVPYVAPTQPSAAPIQLGDKISKPQSEATDALPTARYMANAQTTRNVAHLDLSSAALGGQSQPQADDNTLTTHNAQYTPRPQVPQPSGESYGQQYPQPGTTTSATVRRRTSKTATASPTASATASATVSITVSAPPAPPMSYPSVAQPLTGSGSPTIGTPTPQGEPPTDADLIARSVPPLRGSYDPNGAGGQPPLSQRARTELELNALEGAYSGFIGGTGYARYRSGTPGFDRLTDFESPFEVSGVLGKTVRATIVTRPISLNNGALDNSFFQSSTGTIPVLGTFPGNALVAPPQQFASGIGGELQLASTNYALALGYTPYEFLVGNVIGRGQWRLFGRHLTFYGERDSVKDTQLSYAGMRDPGSATPFSGGNIWGGVVSTGGGLRLDIGGAKSGLYVAGGGADLTGTHVLENRRYDGQMGASFRVHQWPGYGSLNVGGNFFGMHYDHNELGMTYGQGGYFSPNVYFLASVPVTYTGYYKNDLHYTIAGAVGVHSFQEDKAPYFPLDLPLQTGFSNAQTPSTSNTGINYSLNSEGAYHFNDHWFIGAFLSANNTNNYDDVSGGFFVHYLFKPQYPTEDYPTGLFPVAGTRALRVP